MVLAVRNRSIELLMSLGENPFVRAFSFNSPNISSDTSTTVTFQPRSNIFFIFDSSVQDCSQPARRSLLRGGALLYSAPINVHQCCVISFRRVLGFILFAAFAPHRDRFRPAIPCAFYLRPQVLSIARSEVHTCSSTLDNFRHDPQSRGDNWS